MNTTAATPQAPGAVRWRRRKAARPSEIHAAALACFAERGFAATRLEDVARRAGVSKGTLYLYVASKEDLFKTVVRETLLPRLAMLEGQVDSQASAAATLHMLIEAWANIIEHSPLSALPKVVLSEAGNFPDLARFYLDEVVHRGQRLVGGIIARGVAAGEFRAVSPHATMSLLGSMVFLMLWKQSLGRFEEPPLDVAAVGRAHLDLVLQGLLAEGGAKRSTSGRRRGVSKSNDAPAPARRSRGRRKSG